MLTGENVREIVKCKSCSKSWRIYSNANLSNREQRELRKIIRTYEYEALLNGLITVQLKQIKKRACNAIVAKLVLKLIRTRRSYSKAPFLWAINVKYRERKSWREVQYKPPKQTNRGLVVLKTIDKFIFKVLWNESIR